MRYSISLILLLLCTRELAAIQPDDQKWTVTLENITPGNPTPIIATPVITATGTVYVGVSSRLFAIIPAKVTDVSSNSMASQFLYQFPSSLVTSAVSPVLSPDGNYLYVTYATLVLGQKDQSLNAVFATFDLKRPDLADPIWSYPENNTLFSAPSVDKVGAVYVKAISNGILHNDGKFTGLPHLLKISGNKTVPDVTTVEFTNKEDSISLGQDPVGPAIYNDGRATGGAAIGVRANNGTVPYLFYTLFEKAKFWWPFSPDYYHYRGWGGDSLPDAKPDTKYSAPAIDNNPNNPTSRGTIYLATSSGDLEAYQGNVDNHYFSRYWSQPVSTSDLSKSTPVADNDTVYIGDSADSVVYAISSVQQSDNWHAGMGLFSPGFTRRPAVDAANSLVYFVGNNGDLYAIDTICHRLVWRCMGTHIVTDPVVGADGTVVVVNRDNEVIAYQGGRLHKSK